jgi:polar amino acid transport system substrate-binding protein
MLVRIASITAAAAVLALAWSPCAQAARRCDKVIISGHPAYPPTTWYDGHQMRGGWHLIAARVFDDLGIPYEIRYEGPWARVLASARSGQVDMLATLKVNNERRTYLTFSRVGGTAAPITVFVKRDAGFAYAGKNDLIGKRGGITRGEGYGQEIDTFVHTRLQVEEVGDFATNLKKLGVGRIQYAISGYYPGTAKLALLGMEDQFVALKPDLSEELNHFAFVTGSPCVKYLPAFDKHLAQLLKDGTVARLLDEGAGYWRAHASLF